MGSLPTMDNKRTLTQNSACHLYFSMLSDELNKAGFDIKRTLRKDFEIPWSPELVKSLIWKQVQEAMTEKKSTTKLDTHEISEIYETINRHIAQTTGVSVPFPDHYSQSLKGE